MEKEQERQVCLQDFHYLKPFHCRKPLFLQNVHSVHLNPWSCQQAALFFHQAHVADGEVNVTRRFAHTILHCVSSDTVASEGSCSFYCADVPNSCKEG